MTWEQIHPAINAALNGTCAVLLIVGRVAIARRDAEAHRRYMLAAFVTSAVFLVSYLIRFATTGAHRYPGEGWDKIAYLVILFSHMVLAVVLVPFVLRALQLALRADFARPPAGREVGLADLDVRLGDGRARLLHAVSAPALRQLTP